MRGSVEGVDAEHWVLTTDEGRTLLDEVGSVVTPGPGDVARWRSRAEPAHVTAALRLVEARRKGKTKFSRADRMWLETTGIEQATAEPVARHKAGRFAGRCGVAVDLCSGVGGDALALAAATDGVLAVDLDPGMARRLLWNADVYGVAGRILPVRSRAESFPVQAGAWVHVDPDRRAHVGARARTVADYAPGLSFLRALAAKVPAGAIKLGPASDFAEHFGGAGYEAEVVSLAGECKEVTVWFGAAATCRRRATVLPGGTTWTDRDADPGARIPINPPGAWVFDPDPALIRSGLLDGYAAAHRLSRFAAGVDYLTGPDRITSPFLAAFEVLDILPLDLKRVRRALAERGVGPLEIKTRGVSHRPEELRTRLRLSGDRPATLILAGGHGPAQAVIASRVTDGR